MKNQLSFAIISDYCMEYSSGADALLEDLERETHLKTIAPQMLAGAHQGKFLEMMSTLLRPKKILEIGSFTGYSAICLARGLQDGGHLDALELDPQYSSIFQRYVERAGLKDRITLHNGDAREILKQFHGPYDLIFIDAGKQEYPEYYEHAVDLIDPAGLILIDNMLWDGKVLQDTDDADAIVLRQLANTIRHDARVECVLLPLRDGIMMVKQLAISN